MCRSKLVVFSPKHEIRTVVAMRWGGIKNGALLKLIEREGFRCFLPATRTWQRSNALKAALCRADYVRDQLACD